MRRGSGNGTCSGEGTIDDRRSKRCGWQLSLTLGHSSVQLGYCGFFHLGQLRSVTGNGGQIRLVTRQRRAEAKRIVTNDVK